ncbi:uncharacterized protein M421DRAFT_10480 [Didymella exigua CBS 183.55]|uniref:Uncharacterized protein n=1 Tax=Didymella exigua CBS 183.55 TaxID=1150837 RepID=A0A6A5R5P7_9PLEO|nr:uncharacterized protein M421DRAFT_10480 [Didymella exigua CBS 183.55]KAF1922520.1 hypothetical protein M421DRAFT_10480 [Didymella exigua CBS 183.55]
MKFNKFEVLASLLCSWLAGFALGLWRSEGSRSLFTGLVIAIFAAVATVAIYKCVSADKTIAQLNRNVGEVHTMAIIDLQNAHRKHVIKVKSTHNQNMRKAQNEIRRVTLNFDRFNSEYDYIATMYQTRRASTLSEMTTSTTSRRSSRSSASSAPQLRLRRSLRLPPRLT